jgi:hypothetical protein
MPRRKIITWAKITHLAGERFPLHATYSKDKDREAAPGVEVEAAAEATWGLAMYADVEALVSEEPAVDVKHHA